MKTGPYVKEVTAQVVGQASRLHHRASRPRRLDQGRDALLAGETPAPLPEQLLKEARRPVAQSAFTLVEMVVAMAIIGAVVAALYAAITSSFGTIRLARENLRATQIMMEKMEGIRLYNWDQITTNGYVPTNFAVPYDPAGDITSGVVYSGSLSIVPVALNASYSNDLRLVTVKLNWTNGLPRQRQRSTYICRTGIQNYLY